MTPRLLLLAASTLALAGCNYTSTTDTRIKDEQTLRTLDAKWAISAGEHNLDATLAPYAETAIVLPPDEPAATTPTAIHDSWSKSLNALTGLTWEPTRVEVARSGDLAYLTGKWTATRKQGNVPLAGKLVEVWHKQPDGSWKCIADTWNNDAPTK